MKIGIGEVVKYDEKSRTIDIFDYEGGLLQNVPLETLPQITPGLYVRPRGPSVVLQRSDLALASTVDQMFQNPGTSVVYAAYGPGQVRVLSFLSNFSVGMMFKVTPPGRPREVYEEFKVKPGELLLAAVPPPSIRKQENVESSEVFKIAGPKIYLQVDGTMSLSGGAPNAFLDVKSFTDASILIGPLTATISSQNNLTEHFSFDISNKGLKLSKVTALKPLVSWEMGATTDPFDFRFKNLLSSITVKKTGDIEIKGPTASVTLNATGTIEVKNTTTTVSIGVTGNVTINTSGKVEVKGSEIVFGNAAKKLVTESLQNVLDSLTSALNSHIHTAPNGPTSGPQRPGPNPEPLTFTANITPALTTITKAT